VLSAKLKRLDAWNTRRRELAHIYDDLLDNPGITLPTTPDGLESNHHRYAIRSERRDAVRNALLVSGIECGIHYPVPLHLQPALRSYGYRSGDFPFSERAADTVLSLPMHPHLSEPDLEVVAETVCQALTRNHSLFAGGHYKTAPACPPHTRWAASMSAGGPLAFEPLAFKGSGGRFNRFSRHDSHEKWLIPDGYPPVPIRVKITEEL
jgi:hypothetical protein